MSDAQLREEVESLRRDLAMLAAGQRSRRRGGAAALAVALLVLAGVAFAQPMLTTFAPNTPALASEVNGNFTQVSAFTVPPGAVMLFERASCPTGWSAYTAGEGRILMARPSNGTLSLAFGSALSGDAEKIHGHGGTTANDGAHAHTGITNGFHSYTGLGNRSNTNYNLTAGYLSEYHMRETLLIDYGGAHTHGLSVAGTGGSAVLPYVYLTACKKD